MKSEIKPTLKHGHPMPSPLGSLFKNNSLKSGCVRKKLKQIHNQAETWEEHPSRTEGGSALNSKKAIMLVKGTTNGEHGGREANSQSPRLLLRVSYAVLGNTTHSDARKDHCGH